MDAIYGTCRSCEGMRQQVATLQERVAALEAALAAARKNSGNSSKPTSSDMAKPSPPKRDKNKKNKCRCGGQPGHPWHERAAFGPEEIDQAWDYTLSHCPDCGRRTHAVDEPPRVVQQVEIVARPIEVTEHRDHCCFCSRCQKTHFAPLPAEVRRAGLVGPRLTAVVACLKGRLPLFVQHDPQIPA